MSLFLHKRKPLNRVGFVAMTQELVASFTCPVCRRDQITVSAVNTSVAICICDICEAQFTVFMKSVRNDEPVREPVRACARKDSPPTRPSDDSDTVHRHEG
jgi:transcription elongation factor Elf1